VWLLQRIPHWHAWVVTEQAVNCAAGKVQAALLVVIYISYAYHCMLGQER
jgi:hypothetical protein